MAEVPKEHDTAWKSVAEAHARMRSEGLASGIQGLQQAVGQFRRAADRGAESYVLRLLAGVYHEIGNFEEAVKCQRAGIEAARSLARPGTRIVEHWDGLGMALSNMGQWQEAERIYKQALEETRKPVRALRELRAHILKHLADVYLRYAGRTEEAIQMYDEAISISRDCGDKFNIAAALNFKGQALSHLHRSEEAIHCYEQARILAEEIGEKGLIAACYAELGADYLNLGNLAVSRQYVEQALALDKEYGNKQGICRDMFLLGVIQNDMEQPEAKETLEQAFLLAREIHDAKLVVSISMRLATLLDRQLRGSQAKDYLEQALEYCRELGDQQTEIAINIRIAAHEDQSELFSRLEKSAVVARDRGFLGLEESIERSLAHAHEKHGDLIQARQHYSRAAQLLERMRSGYQAEEHLRAFSENMAECYERLVDISLQLREDREAFIWAECSRARVLHMMRNNRSLRAIKRSEEQRGQYREICDRIIELDRQIQQLEGRRQPVPLSLQQQLQDALLREADLTLTWRRASGLVSSDNQRLETDPDQLISALKALPQRVLVLAYYLGDSGAYAFCFTREGFYVRELGSSVNKLRELIHDFRRDVGVRERNVRDDPAMRDPAVTQTPHTSNEYIADSRRLYDCLLRPIQEEIIRAEHICIVPHGPLHFLPFHALHDGERYLIEMRPISYSPSAAMLIESLQGTNIDIQHALALGDPDSDLPSLLYAREEVARIQDILKQRCRMEVGEQAVRSLILQAGNRSADCGNDDVWHFAMHAMFVRSAPHLSYLQLARTEADDGRLFAYEIAALDRVAPLDVVSACRTAMTGESRGDELNGLLFSFLVAGAQTVMATLWSVADNSTAELMVEFYKHLDGTVTLAEALRQSQISLLRKPATSSPYHWAAVTLHCNWSPVGAPAKNVQTNSLPETEPAALPVEVLMRRGDSFLGHARIENEKHYWALLPDSERKALEEARAVYQQVLQREPEDSAALRQYGIASYGLDEMDTAEKSLSKASSFNEADPIAAAVLGVIYAWRKPDSRLAVKYLERALQINRRLQLAYPPFRTYPLLKALDRCRAEIAIEQLTRELNERPDDSGRYAERGQAYWLFGVNGGHFEENRTKALRDLDRALELDPDNALVLVRKTWIANPGVGPRETYAKAAEKVPNNAEVHLRFAQSLGKDEVDLAISEIRIALKCDGSLPHAYCRLGQRYLDRGDLRGAVDAFETEIRQDPNCFDSHLYLTQIYAALGRQAEARHSLREAVRTTPHEPYQGGPGVGLDDRIVYAIRDLARQMVASGATQPSLSLTQLISLFERASTLANEGRSRDAVEIYSQILTHDPNNARAYAFRGGCYATLRDYEEAIVDLQKATKLDPNNADAWFNLSLVYANEMRYAESRSVLEKARLLDPEKVRREEEKAKHPKQPPQQTPFDLDKALEAAYRESRIQCVHCGRPLRRPLGTQFRLAAADEERVQQGIPYYCSLCRVNSCYDCATKDGSTVKCSKCATELDAWAEGKQTVPGHDSDATAPQTGSCEVCGETSPLRAGRFCESCYAASAQAVAALNYEGAISTECGQCGNQLPVQPGEVFATGGGDLDCKACFAERWKRYRKTHSASANPTVDA